MASAHLHTPSWRQGFARRKNRSASPGLWDGLAGAWFPALGPTGSRLFDIGGRRNDGTLENMSPAGAWDIGEDKYGLNFVKAHSDYVLCGAVPTLTEMTVTANVRPASLTAFWSTIAANAAWSATTGWTLLVTDAAVQFYALPGFYVSHSMSPQDEEHTYSASVSGGAARLYVDGSLVATDTSGSFTDSGVPLRIGARPGNDGTCGVDHFNGAVNYVLVHTRALDSDELRALHSDSAALVRRRTKTFAAPDETSALRPYGVAAGLTYVSGAAAGDTHTTGSAAGALA